MKTIVIGDVHGCADELEALLEKVQYVQGKDRCILAGDLVDRGPDSHRVVRIAEERGLEVVMGNHDEKHIRYRKHLKRKEADHKYKIPMKLSEFKQQVHDSLTDADIEFLKKAKPFARIWYKFIVVHGGIGPGSPEDQDPKLMLRRRFVDKDTGQPLSLGPGFAQPENSVYWTDMWNGPETVLYGHNVHSMEHPYTTTKNGEILAIGLDTGACFGGHLSAIVIYGDVITNIVKVKSKEYISHGKWLESMPGEIE